MPTLLVTGTNSPSFFRAILDQLHVCVPSSSETEIPAASHGVQFENPEAFNEALLKFTLQVEKASQLRKKDRRNMKKIAPKGKSFQGAGSHISGRTSERLHCIQYRQTPYACSRESSPNKKACRTQLQDCSRITGNPEVISLPVGLVPAGIIRMWPESDVP
jgi:hypothetical protein